MLSVIGLIHLHAVVIDHAVAGDRAATGIDEQDCGFHAIQILQFLNTCTAAIEIHIVVTANRLQIGKVGDDRGLLTAEGQVDEVFQLEQLQLACHGLELRGLANIEALQPLCQIVQLIQIDTEVLRDFQDRVETVDCHHFAILFERVADLQCFDHLDALVILLFGDGERNCCNAVFGVVSIAYYRF